jgi:hypothetical protein
MKSMKIDAPFDSIDLTVTGKEWWIMDQTRIIDFPDMSRNDQWMMELCYLIVNEKLEYNLVLKSNLEVKAKGSLRSALEGMPLPTSIFDTNCVYSVNIDFTSKIAVVVTSEDVFVQILNSRIMVKLRPGDGISSTTKDTKICLMDRDVKQTPNFYRFIAVHQNSLDFLKCELNGSLPKYTSKVISSLSPIIATALFRVA